MQALNVYITEEQYKNPPSRNDNIDDETETDLRVYGCELIQQAGIMLKLPQVTMASGQVLFHRFYYRKSFREYDVKNMAMAALFLATKVEETPKPFRDLINVFHHLFQKRDGIDKPEPMDTSKQLYWEMKDKVIHHERQILRELGFMVYVELPHKYLLNYSMHVLKCNQELAQHAWNFVNDSLRTDVCVRFLPQQIAATAIYMAARVLRVKLPESPHPWWELFECNLSDIDEICVAISRLYQRPKATYVDARKFILAKPTESTPPPPPLPPAPPAPAPETNEDHSPSAMDISPSPTNGKDAPPRKDIKEEEKHKERDTEKDRDHKGRHYRDKTKEKDRDRRSKSKERDHRDKDRDRDSHRDRDKDNRDKDRDRDSHRDKELDRNRGREKDRDRDRLDRDRAKDRDRDGRKREKDDTDVHEFKPYSKYTHEYDQDNRRPRKKRSPSYY